MADERDQRLKEHGKVQVRRVGTVLSVTCPYHEDFNKGAKALKGQWNPQERVWIFSVNQRDRLLKLIDKIYGGGKVEQKQRWCAHRYLKISGGIKCMLCGLFKERST